jgi:hypothetical protein
MPYCALLLTLFFTISDLPLPKEPLQSAKVTAKGKQGWWRTWINDDGQKTDSTIARYRRYISYKNNTIVDSVLDFRQDGTLAQIATMVNDSTYHGTVKKYTESGTLESIEQWQQGVRQGPFVRFFMNGKVRARGEFVDGKRSGEWTTFHENDSVKTRGQYENGEKTGTWTTLSIDGKPTLQEEYVDGAALTWYMMKDSAEEALSDLDFSKAQRFAALAESMASRDFEHAEAISFALKPITIAIAFRMGDTVTGSRLLNQFIGVSSKQPARTAAESFKKLLDIGSYTFARSAWLEQVALHQVRLAIDSSVSPRSMAEYVHASLRLCRSSMFTDSPQYLDTLAELVSGYARLGVPLQKQEYNADSLVLTRAAQLVRVAQLTTDGQSPDSLRDHLYRFRALERLNPVAHEVAATDAWVTIAADELQDSAIVDSIFARKPRMDMVMDVGGFESPVGFDGSPKKRLPQSYFNNESVVIGLVSRGYGRLAPGNLLSYWFRKVKTGDSIFATVHPKMFNVLLFSYSRQRYLNVVKNASKDDRAVDALSIVSSEICPLINDPRFSEYFNNEKYYSEELKSDKVYLSIIESCKPRRSRIGRPSMQR